MTVPFYLTSGRDLGPRLRSGNTPRGKKKLKVCAIPVAIEVSRLRGAGKCNPSLSPRAPRCVCACLARVRMVTRAVAARLRQSLDQHACHGTLDKFAIHDSTAFFSMCAAPCAACGTLESLSIHPYSATLVRTPLPLGMCAHVHVVLEGCLRGGRAIFLHLATVNMCDGA
jgi:hypothetical protein